MTHTHTHTHTRARARAARARARGFRFLAVIPGFTCLKKVKFWELLWQHLLPSGRLSCLPTNSIKALKDMLGFCLSL